MLLKYLRVFWSTVCVWYKQFHELEHQAPRTIFIYNFITHELAENCYLYCHLPMYMCLCGQKKATPRSRKWPTKTASAGACRRGWCSWWGWCSASSCLQVITLTCTLTGTDGHAYMDRWSHVHARLQRQVIMLTATGGHAFTHDFRDRWSRLHARLQGQVITLTCTLTWQVVTLTGAGDHVYKGRWSLLQWQVITLTEAGDHSYRGRWSRLHASLQGQMVTLIGAGDHAYMHAYRDRWSC